MRLTATIQGSGEHWELMSSIRNIPVLRRLEQLCCGDRLREWGVFSLEKAPGGSHCGLSILKGDLNLGTDFLVGTAAIEKGEVALN